MSAKTWFDLSFFICFWPIWGLLGLGVLNIFEALFPKSKVADRAWLVLGTALQSNWFVCLFMGSVMLGVIFKMIGSFL